MATSMPRLGSLAIINQFNGNELTPYKMINSCYSFVDQNKAVHVAQVFVYDNIKKIVIPLKDAGGLSKNPSVKEGVHAFAWADNIWMDTLN